MGTGYWDGCIGARIVIPILVGASSFLAACGEGDSTVTQADDDRAATSTTAPAGEQELPNACPAEGCKVNIASATREGAELKLVFEANFAPDISRNHFHVYWDTFTAEQVTTDAQTRFGATQGQWAPTANNPYTSGDAASVGSRGKSNRICVTAGDRHHNVIDPAIFDCHDVSPLL